MSRASGHRYVQIGFNRAGTSSIRDYFQRAGFNVADHRLTHGARRGALIADFIADNLDVGRAPLAGMDDVQVFTDMESVSLERIVYGHRHFREIAEAHPETRFILNLRDRKAWLKSRAGFGGYLATCAAFHGVSESEMLALWAEEWDTHIRDVTEYFAGTARLFVLDIDAPDERGLSAFVGLTTERPFRRINMAPNGPVSRVLARYGGTPWAKLMPQGVRNFIKRF